MNKLFKLLAVGAVCSLGMVGCGLLPEDSTTPVITIDDIGSIDAGTYKNVTGKVTADEEITSISYSIEKGGSPVTTVTVTGPSSSAEKSIDFSGNNTIKITVADNAEAGDYQLVIKAEAGAEGSGSFDFSVKAKTVTGTKLTEKTGTISNVFGPDKGAYNLVTGERVGSTGEEATKDLKDMSLVGEGFAGKLTSGNGSKFVAVSDAAAYTDATDISVKALADAATAADITIADGKIFAVKLGSSRGYAIVKITRYAPTAGTSTGDNKGEADFSYKFTN